MDFLHNQESIEGFLRKHAKPYDPTTDDYDRPPFAADIKSEGRSAYYNFHYYHTKVPPEVIRDLISHYTSPGDVVLDPFCGSGMTGLGALLSDSTEMNSTGKGRQMNPRLVILNDLSPSACHIAENYNLFIDPDQVGQAFSEISEKVAHEFNYLYSVEHYEPAVGIYDPNNPEVAARLNRGTKLPAMLFADSESAGWHLVSRKDIEERLGYSISRLSNDNEAIDSNQWIVIPAIMHYAVWSDVLICEGMTTVEVSTGKSRNGKPITRKTRVPRGCGGFINLYEVAMDRTSSELNDSFTCPHCHQVWKKVQLSRSHSEPVVVSYRFNGLKARKKGVGGALLSSSRPVSVSDKKRIQHIANRPIPDSFKDEEIDQGREMMRHGLLKRGVKTISDFYTHRNLCGLAMLWREILAVAEERVRKKLEFCFTSQVMRASRLRRMRPFGPGEQLSGTLYVASLTVETNVMNLISHAVHEYSEAFPRWMLRIPRKAFIHCGTATDLWFVPDASVDFVFTDPPFGRNIYYADCAMLWENWLQCKTEEVEEIVVNERRVGSFFKSVEDYGKLMESALKEMSRVLKAGRYAVIEFNNSDGAIFHVVKQAINDAGFQIEGMFVLDKGVKTFKQLKGANEGEAVVDKDVMFTLRKPSGRKVADLSDDPDLERQIVEIVQEHLRILPNRIKIDPSKYSDDHRTTATINSMLMNTLIPKGVNVYRLNLPYIERVCTRYFRTVGQKWYLRGEAIGNGTKGELFQEEIGIRDEESGIAWLRQVLTAGPKTVGELKPLWMRATGLLPLEISQQLDLDALLRENFWKDADTNRWREPTPEEREKMNDSRTLHVLRDVERFLVGVLKRQTSDSDRCEWIDVLFNACRAIEEQENEELPALRDFDPGKGYQMISQLFHGILKDHVPPDIFIRAEKQARVASSRLKDVGPEEKQEKKESKNKMQQEFDW